MITHPHNNLINLPTTYPIYYLLTTYPIYYLPTTYPIYYLPSLTRFNFHSLAY
jgi:hypothetical protein